MKLRKKKTGEILRSVHGKFTMDGGGIELFDGNTEYTYSSIAELIDEWEDVPEDDVKDFPNFEYWKLDGIKSKPTGLIVAPEDYVAPNGKQYFTWDEAMELEEKVLKPNGWRLPTRSEWVLLCEEFGQDENGKLNGSALAKNLNLPMNGRLDYYDSSSYGVGSYGLYWSSTIVDSSRAYYLYFSSSSARTNNNVKMNGYSVRCVWSGS